MNFPRKQTTSSRNFFVKLSLSILILKLSRYDLPTIPCSHPANCKFVSPRDSVTVQFEEQLAAFDIEIEGWKKALKSNA